MSTIPSPALTDAPVERVQLDDSSWVDVVRGIVPTDIARATYDDLLTNVAWTQNSNFRYERNVPEPRLGAHQSGIATHPVLAAVQQWISARYHVRFDGVSLAQYRDGRDGVGWHRDREMHWLDDTIIGVFTLGATRPFLIAPLERSARTGAPAGARPRIARDHGDDGHDGTAGANLDLRPAAGDLLVMGGRCQADWLHAVPQMPATPCTPRISAQWRWTSRTGRRDPNPSYFAPRHFSRR
jgi:alkylated DNA repair dioxygenase AlkB